MPFQSAPNCAEAVIRVIGTGAVINNVLHFVKTTGYDEADIAGLANNIDSWFGTEIRPRLGNAFTYVNTLARGLQNVVDFSVLDNGSAGVGGVASVPTPANAALVITLRTGHTGRSARGRIYFGGLPQSSILDTTHWVAAEATAFATKSALIGAYLAGTGWQHCVLSRVTLGALRPYAVPYVITSYSARNNDIDSQRGRLAIGH